MAGWDRRAPRDPELPVVNEYQLRNGNGQAYVTEPRQLGEAEIRALVRLAQIGWDVTVSAPEHCACPGRRCASPSAPTAAPTGHRSKLAAESSSVPVTIFLLAVEIPSEPRRQPHR